MGGSQGRDGQPNCVVEETETQKWAVTATSPTNVHGGRPQFQSPKQELPGQKFLGHKFVN